MNKPGDPLMDRMDPAYIQKIWPTAPSPLKTIRAKCLDCTCDQPKEIRECASTNCPLWPYRMGKNPYFQISEDERNRRRQRGQEASKNFVNSSR